VESDEDVLRAMNVANVDGFVDCYELQLLNYSEEIDLKEKVGKTVLFYFDDTHTKPVDLLVESVNVILNGSNLLVLEGEKLLV
jgi:hypothetical protein